VNINGSAAQNKGHGVFLDENAADATIGTTLTTAVSTARSTATTSVSSSTTSVSSTSTVFSTVSFTTGTTVVTNATTTQTSSTTTLPSTTLYSVFASNRVYITGNNRDGISCRAKNLVVSNTWIGLAPPHTAMATEMDSTTTHVVTEDVIGNGGAGIRLTSTAVDARIGTTPFNQCSAGGYVSYVVCTTASCCAAAKPALAAGNLALVDTKESCKAAAKYLQLAATIMTEGAANYGDSKPQGCHLSAGNLYLNDNWVGRPDPCGLGWRAAYNVCPAAKTPPLTPTIMQCTSPNQNTNNQSVSSLTAVRISGNKDTGITSAAARTAIAHTIVGLGPTGLYSPDGRDAFGNGGAAGIVLDKSAAKATIGVDADSPRPYGCECNGHVSSEGKGGPSCTSRYENKPMCYVDPDVCFNSRVSTTQTMPGTGISMHYSTLACRPIAVDITTVYISGNTGSGIQNAAPGLNVGNAAIGFDASGAAAPNTGAAGIELLPTATNCNVGGSGDIRPEIGTWIAGNAGHGISAAGVSVKIRSTAIGFNIEKEPVQNNGYGVLVEPVFGGETSATPKPQFETNSTIGASGYCGVRVGYGCLPASSNSRRTIHSLRPLDNSTKAQLSTSKLKQMNGQLTGACQRCSCINDITAALSSNNTYTTIVDCTEATTDKVPNFGRNFFSSMPANTS
jgi:hypothetical protein